MRPRNHLLRFGILFFGAAIACAQVVNANSRPSEEDKQLNKLIAKAKKVKTYRRLTTPEIKEAIGLPINRHTAAFLTNPGFTPVAQLPSGALLKRDGYYFMLVVGKVTYSFLQAQAPAGNEVLFVCDHGLPWWGWISVPGVCGAAILPAPDRTAQLEEYSRLTAVDRGAGDEYRETSAGRTYLAKLTPLFEAILRRCSGLAPADDRKFAWLGRVAESGKVVRTGVIPDSPPYNETSPYYDCINKQARTLNGTAPPRSDGDIMWEGGWPVEIRWKHDRTGAALIKW